MKTSTRVAIAIVVLAAAAAVAVVKSRTGCGGARARSGRCSSRLLRARFPRSAAAPSTDPLPRLMEVGSTTCVPCKAMEPVLAELRKEYAGRMEVVFVERRLSSLSSRSSWA